MTKVVNGVFLPEDIYRGISMAKPEDRLKAYDALFAYAFDGTMPECPESPSMWYALFITGKAWFDGTVDFEMMGAEAKPRIMNISLDGE